MNGKGTAASVGAIAGLALGFRDYRLEMDRDVRQNRATSANALDLGLDNQRRLNQMLSNGDFVRLADDHVSDLFVGLSFPDQSAPVVPSAFASIPSVLPLPDLSEALAIAPSVWPGPVNVYNNDGTLSTPAAAFSGQNVAMGVALGNAAFRASAMGLSETTMPTANKLAQLHRLHRALVSTLGLFESAPLTLAQLKTMWLNLLSPVAVTPASVASGLIWSLISNAPNLNTFTSEAVIYSVPIPAGCMQLGQAVEAIVSGFTVGVGGGGNTVVYRARLDSLGGPLLISTPALVLTGPDTFNLSVQLSRAAGADSSANFVVTPKWAVAVAGAGSSGSTSTVNTVAFDHTVQHYLLFTATYGLSAAGNAVQGQSALLRKL